MNVMDEVDVLGLFRLDFSSFEYEDFISSYSVVLAQAVESDFESCTDLLFFSSFINAISDFQKETFCCYDISEVELSNYIFLKYNQVISTPKERLESVDILFIETFCCQQALGQLYPSDFTQELVCTMYQNVYHVDQVVNDLPKQKILQ